MSPYLEQMTREQVPTFWMLELPLYVIVADYGDAMVASFMQKHVQSLSRLHFAVFCSTFDLFCPDSSESIIPHVNTHPKRSFSKNHQFLVKRVNFAC